MIYMRGLKAKDLMAIVDFIYLGEANIYQEDLDGFLALAEELQLKGLSSSQNHTEEDIQKQPQEKAKLKMTAKQENISSEATMEKKQERIFTSI